MSLPSLMHGFSFPTPEDRAQIILLFGPIVCARVLLCQFWAQFSRVVGVCAVIHFSSMDLQVRKLRLFLWKERRPRRRGPGCWGNVGRAVSGKIQPAWRASYDSDQLSQTPACSWVIKSNSVTRSGDGPTPMSLAQIPDPQICNW